MNIQAFMLSCPERAAIREQTLANLKETDWQDDVTVILDQQSSADSRERMTLNARRLLESALAASGWDYLLFLEDDLDFNRHLRHNLLHWRPIGERAVQLASLYNPSIRSRFEMFSFHYSLADPEAVYGSQAFLIERGCVDYIADHFDEVPALHDIKFSRLASRLGPVFYHCPSLVQHVGVPSTWNGRAHWANDFEREFRTQAPQVRP
ncbi:MAG: hypothetical protein L0Y72_29030 [Gemmataceae bacterium]|nr:hypothetical protein [Gemmataceae bacterium]